jgi:hypothetical protein
MNGFGFIEYEDAMDARDVVPGMLSPTSRPLIPLEAFDNRGGPNLSSMPVPC